MAGSSRSRTTAAGAAGLAFRGRRPEPAGFWIRHRPARWPGPETPWLDLAAGGLGTSRPDVALDREPRGLDAATDLVYLPPVAGARRDERDRLAAGLAERGLPLLVQLRPGETAPAAAAATIWDPLPQLVAGELDALSSLPAGAVVAWALIAGISDRASFVVSGLDHLVRAGVACVVPVAPELDPRQKRRLAGADEEAFASLFHGAPPSRRGFARLAAAAGLATRFDRPEPAMATPRSGNRRVAARLAQIADLWLRLGRAEGGAQELFRAARWIEEFEHDLAGLAREGNLGVLSWLSDTARRQVEECLAAETPPLLGELEAEYTGGGHHE